MANSWNYIFENVQDKIYNFKIRLEQFTDKTKKAKKYWLIGTELSYITNANRYCLSFYLCQKYVV